MLNDIVMAQIAAEDLSGARQTAESITVVRPQVAAYATLANVHVKLGNLPAAQTLALRIGDPVARGDILRQIVSAHCLNGDVEAARAMLPSIEDKQYSAMAFGDVAAARVENDDLPGAFKVVARARRSARNEIYGRISLARRRAVTSPARSRRYSSSTSPWRVRWFKVASAYNVWNARMPPGLEKYWPPRSTGSSKQM